MTESDGAFLTGRLLIAMPTIGDPRFERSVILMCAHNAEHAMGIAVNRPVEGLTIGAVLKRLKVKATASSIVLPEDLVLMGGPVERDRGFVLHTDDYECPDSSVPVGHGISMTASSEVLEALAAQSGRPRRSVLALGYAGWDGGQLERELQENTWLTCDADEALVFGDDHARKWSQALAKIGVSAAQISSMAGRA